MFIRSKVPLTYQQPYEPKICPVSFTNSCFRVQEGFPKVHRLTPKNLNLVETKNTYYKAKFLYVLLYEHQFLGSGQFAESCTEWTNLPPHVSDQTFSSCFFLENSPPTTKDPTFRYFLLRDISFVTLYSQNDVLSKQKLTYRHHEK